MNVIFNIRKKKNRGLTLLEVIISLAILGIIIGPILSLSLTSAKISNYSNEKILATSLGQQCMEYIKNKDVNLINFSEIGLEKNEDIEMKNLLKDNDENVTDFDLFKFPDSKTQYKNIIAKIKYSISNELVKTEYSDISNYDMIINVDENNKVSIRNNEGIQGNEVVLSEGKLFDVSLNNPIIEITNNPSDIACTIKQGNNILYDNVKISKTANSVNGKTGNVKLIFKSSSAITVNVNAKNEEPTDKMLMIKILKTSNCNYKSVVIENNGDYSDKIKCESEIFDINKKDPNKLMKNYQVLVEIWKYDSVIKTKTLLQKIKTYKTL